MRSYFGAMAEFDTFLLVPEVDPPTLSAGGDDIEVEVPRSLEVPRTPVPPDRVAVSRGWMVRSASLRTRVHHRSPSGARFGMRCPFPEMMDKISQGMVLARSACV